jgi:hypothetical protein
LATTDMMLASTVQFSRYGRSRPSSASHALLQPVRTEGATRAWPFPQDPTACSACEPSPGTGVPATSACALASCTNPTVSRCSNRITSAPLEQPFSGRSPETWRWTWTSARLTATPVAP